MEDIVCRDNQPLNEYIEDYINSWRGTPTGIMVNNMFRGGADYEDICAVIGTKYEDWEDYANGN